MIRTVRGLLERDAPSAPRWEIDRALVKLFRRSGDWNNDWDLSMGLYCWAIAADEPAESAARRSLAELRGHAGPRVARSYDEVRAAFDGIYHGLVRYEEIMLEAAVVDELRALGVRRFAVVTGRTRADWDQVSHRIPLPPDTPVATDEDGAKPDPAPLAKVVRATDARAFVVVGDTLGDLRMVQRYGATPLGRERPGESIQICDEEDERAYRAAGARLFARHVSELPEVLRRVRT